MLLLVVRWFGGIKLGKGGLAWAYGEVARRAVKSARLVRRVPVTYLEVELSYEILGGFQRLLQPPPVDVVREDYGDLVRLLLRVAIDALPVFQERLAELGIEAREVAQQSPQTAAGRPGRNR